MIKKIFTYAFSIDFLLKILIIMAIITLAQGHFTVYVEHSNLDISSSHGGFEMKLIEPVVIKSD